MNQSRSSAGVPSRKAAWKWPLALGLPALGIGVFSLFTQASAPPPKNVILMIADGSGANSIAATGMYTGKLGKQIFDGTAWTKSWVSTYPLRASDTPKPAPLDKQQDPDAVYDSRRAWDTTPVATTKEGFPDHFRAYRWHKDNAPDSANSLTAVVTGKKTYDGAINVDGNGNQLPTLAEHAAAAGKSVGAVTTVEISDATPAVGGGAHNISRANRPAIANEMLGAGTLSVIMGAGNPDYDNDGGLRAQPNYQWIGADDWAELKAGNHPGKYTLIQTKQAFEALATAASTPAKLVGIVRSFNSTEFDRAGAKPATEEPYSVPRRTDVPTLSTMVQGALNILDNNPRGMFVLIEGGATDRAMHANNIGRMIEERIEFDDAVAAVSAYLDANIAGNNWSNTLVIVTADHDHLLMGPESDTVPFQDLTDKGIKHVPGYRWQYNQHSNQLVPLFARGPKATMFAACATRRDAYTDVQGRKFGRGPYIDQTQIFAILDKNRCT
jgi:alkaline phosphatase